MKVIQRNTHSKHRTIKQNDKSTAILIQWVGKDPNFLHADSEDSDQTESSLSAQVILLVLSCGV